MYLSHPVRRMRADPIPGAGVTLVIDLGDADRAEVERVVAEAGGDVEDEFRFADLAVTVPETAVGDLCSLSGIERVETDNTLSGTPDDTGGSASRD